MSGDDDDNEKLLADFAAIDQEVQERFGSLAKAPHALSTLAPRLARVAMQLNAGMQGDPPPEQLADVRYELARLDVDRFMEALGRLEAAVARMQGN